MSVEEKPLHEVILDIMFFKDTDKPASFTAEDIFWQMKDPDISERQIKEVLDWLVRKKKAEQRFGKYQIDKYEFVDMANKYEQEEPIEEDSKNHNEIKIVKKVAIQKSKPKPQLKKSSNLYVVNFLYYTTLVFLFFLLIFTGYTILNKPSNLIESIKLSREKPYKPSNLYISVKGDFSEELYKTQVKDISYSFIQQNKTNVKVNTELNRVNDNIIFLQRQLNQLNDVYVKEQEYNKKMFSVYVATLLLVIVITFFLRRK